jgi:hypothetical protein
MLAGPLRIELRLTGSKPVVLPLHHEPIKLLLLVLPPGIDPGLLHYQCSVMPLYYESVTGTPTRSRTEIGQLSVAHGI